MLLQHAQCSSVLTLELTWQPTCQKWHLRVPPKETGQTYRYNGVSTDLLFVFFTSQVGDLVFAAVEIAHKHTEPEVTCITGSGKAEGLGPLKDGHMIHCDLATCRR